MTAPSAMDKRIPKMTVSVTAAVTAAVIAAQLDKIAWDYFEIKAA